MHITIANVQYILVKFSIMFLKGNICLPYFFYLGEKYSQLPFDPCIKTEYFNVNTFIFQRYRKFINTWFEIMLNICGFESYIPAIHSKNILTKNMHVFEATFTHMKIYFLVRDYFFLHCHSKYSCTYVHIFNSPLVYMGILSKFTMQMTVKYDYYTEKVESNIS